MTDHAQQLRDLSGPTRELRQHIPDAWAGFVQLAQHAVADGAIPARIKEAFAVAIAVVDGCEPCIAHHAKAAVRQGTTDEEMAEALAVAMLMSGGPGSTTAPKAWAAFKEFQGADEAS